MPSYGPPIREIQFVLHEVLDLEAHRALPRYADLNRELVDAILTEGGRYAAEVAAPLNGTGDAVGCRWQDGEVMTPPGFPDAYRLYVESGWPSLSASPEYGGQGLPHLLDLPVTEMLTSANWGLSSYPGLTRHAISPLERFASSDIRALYLPRLVAGQWSATMELTEPQCGSDLGLLRTRAVAVSDGTYRISGTKTFITAGEHDLTENIIHLVLARIEGAPAGVKGISLFVVPKFLPDAAGNPGVRNGVRCSRIEEKMGIHASATCEMVYEDATGLLIGERHRGLNAMFTMMNEARLGCGLQGVAIAEVAYQNAVAYSRNRLQGRAPGSHADPAGAADPIILHPDVRRMLLMIRSFTEGGRALAYWAGLQADLAELHPDPDVRRQAERLLEVLTPIVKSYLTDQGVEAASHALQCLGGHGYVREWGLEQFLRDARIAPLYEGTNGIQAMDLVGRKLTSDGGRSLEALFALIDEFCSDAAADPALAAPLAALREVLCLAHEATRMLLRPQAPPADGSGAVAHDYLNLIALLATGYLWARMWRTALARTASATPGDQAFYQAKLCTARFFFSVRLPMAQVHFARVGAGPQPVMALAADAF